MTWGCPAEAPLPICRTAVPGLLQGGEPLGGILRRVDTRIQAVREIIKFILPTTILYMGKPKPREVK